jgi:hypothetical protein
MTRFIILQYNCGHANGGKLKPFFLSAEPSSHRVLAIQEPGWNKHTKSTFCPRGYTLAYEAAEETKVCFMVSKELGIDSWRFRHVSPYIAVLRVQLGQEFLTIVNVYNPINCTAHTEAITECIRTLDETDPSDQIVLLGDFNLHHPAWGGRSSRTEAMAERLLTEASARSLELCTPPGEATWRRGQSSTVIDLTFATQDICERLVVCGPRDDWALTPDHIPIQIEFEADQPPPPEGQRFALKRLNKAALLAHVKSSGWEQERTPLAALQTAIREGLEAYCPRSRPSVHANQKWEPEASVLLRNARQARRDFKRTGDEADHERSLAHTNELAKALRRSSRNNWRRFVAELKEQPPQPYQSLWRLMRWSRERAGMPACPHIPPLRASANETPVNGDDERMRLLAERFFPPPGEADLSDITPNLRRQLLELRPAHHRNELIELDDAIESTPSTPAQVPITHVVSAEDIQYYVKLLPWNKAPGPDGIPNEVLQDVVRDNAEAVARATTRCLETGEIPASFKETTTCTLKKTGKKDYTLVSAYRPIALENTIAKLAETIIAKRLASAAEEHGLLPWNQMGGRRHRSTLSAVRLLTDSIHTAWTAKPGCVVSMLGLDLAGAFDNVSHIRLLHTLLRKGLPPWLIRFVASFLDGRRTRITFAGYQGPWIPIQSGIPQGSPLSPILFIFFISELLEAFEEPGQDDVLGFGFIDDTSLVAWGDSAWDNCRRLTTAHDRCVAWAKRYGARFAPEKYQLMHFTRRRRHSSEDLANTIQINGTETELCATSLRILGVWVDPKLQWREQVKISAARGNGLFDALSRITASTWGPSMRRSRLLYTAVVRPAMMYGSQVWGRRQSGDPIAASLLKPLAKVQAECLKKITGAYKGTPRIAVEREAGVLPLAIWTEANALQYAISTTHLGVEARAARTVDKIWSSLSNQPTATRPATQSEATRKAAEAREEEIRLWKENTPAGPRCNVGRNPRRPRNAPRNPSRRKRKTKALTLLRQWADLEWCRRWQQAGKEKEASTWKGRWIDRPDKLYDGLTKAESTALVLLRTEAIGLNAWLAKRRVPGVDKACPCGWHVQSVTHVLLHCPRYDREDLLRRLSTQRVDRILSEPTQAAAAAKWLISHDVLEQFKVAKEISEEDPASYRDPPGLTYWSI